MIERMKRMIDSIDYMAVLTAMRDPAKTMQPALTKEAHLSFCPLAGQGSYMHIYLYLIISMFILTNTIVTSGGQICSVCRHEEKCKHKVFLN